MLPGDAFESFRSSSRPIPCGPFDLAPGVVNHSRGWFTPAAFDPQEGQFVGEDA